MSGEGGLTVGSTTEMSNMEWGVVTENGIEKLMSDAGYMITKNDAAFDQVRYTAWYPNPKSPKGFSLLMTGFTNNSQARRKCEVHFEQNAKA